MSRCQRLGIHYKKCVYKNANTVCIYPFINLDGIMKKQILIIIAVIVVGLLVFLQLSQSPSS